MLSIRKTVATAAATALIATPAAVLTASPAAAADREFRYAGADVEFDVSKDDGRFDVEVDVDDAKPGSRWRVVLRHNGKRFHKNVHRATDGDFDIDKNRPNTNGRDVFKLRIKRIGGPKAVTRVIRTR